MKYLFLTIGLLLLLFGSALWWTSPDASSDVPVLYWITDRNPMRTDQVNRFHRWLVREGHGREVVIATPQDAQRLRHGIAPTLADDIIAGQPETAPIFDENIDASKLPITVRIPAFELRLDTANKDTTKQKIQSVSGVASDLMDIFNGENMRMFQAMNVLADVTDAAHTHNFDLSQTYSSLEAELCVDGRQYMFPCNAGTLSYWVNIDTFEQHGIQPPPRRWTVQEFERIGVAFCEAANRGKRRRDVFFADSIDMPTLYRGYGASVYNETLTAAAIDSPGYVEALKTMKRWIYDLNILPTPDDQDSFSTGQGFKGASLQLFASGNYAMIYGGRYFLLQFRQMNGLGRMTVSEVPHAVFPNGTIGTRGTAVYRGSPHQDLAVLFLAYLNSPDYNMQIVRSADALPPNPRYLTTPEYLAPAEYPNEHDVHQGFAEITRSIAVAGEYSPFVLPDVVMIKVRYYEEQFTVGMITAEQAARRTAAAINREIARFLDENPNRRELYDQRCELQQKIDRLKASGQPVPRDWVANAFHKAYLEHLGMLTDSTPTSEEE
ncbi:ABC transporter substrate-binding protein [Mucisphaera calidilacus]|uniref:Bacterial extracellular solute-binding protein n=1 Tax=Mucisphaera calidilacus TaxID=2527982 RepID=A0A518BU75_9BACT|nr:extracellular solute-binding protein [Mucisphaera calidilacus]QDU70553.1 Bacterial extracellular solute-binding protein [Mucisphaera calidilacus]